MSKITRLAEARRSYVLGTIRAAATSDGVAVKANHYRLRAEELRVIAGEVLLKETSRTLLSLADSYEQMALMVENGLASASADSDDSEST
jgi:hypothetical protein